MELFDEEERLRLERRRSSTPLDEGFVDDEEWSSPVAKILKLPFDHESWQHAQEILEPPSPRSRKVADEARSIAARHIIDRLKEENLLGNINKVAPRLRSAVELLSKPDGDYVFPKFQFVVNELRYKYPEVYTSVIKNVGLRIPIDMKPSTMLVSLAKSTVENSSGELDMDWGKFVALLALAGALAVDSVKAEYPDGVAEVVETFGLIVEQILGEWILQDVQEEGSGGGGGGGGWEGFIQSNVYTAKLSPVPRTIIILLVLSFLLYYLGSILISLFVSLIPLPKDVYFYGKWGGIYPKAFSPTTATNFCVAPKNPLQYLISRRFYDFQDFDFDSCW